MVFLSQQIGNQGFVHYAGQVFDEWHFMLRGTLGVRAYREMRDNDPIIGSALNLTQAMLRQTKWFSKPAHGGDDAIAAALFLEGVMNDMRKGHTWSMFMSDAISFLWFGWSLFEIVTKQRLGKNPGVGLDGKELASSKFDDGRLGLDALYIRAQETLDDWLFDDETGDTLGMWQSSTPRFERRFIPLAKSLLLRTENNKGSPEGRSWLRNAYRPYYFTKRLEDIEGTGFERNLNGFPVIFLPEKMCADDAQPNLKKARAGYDRKGQLMRVNSLGSMTFPARTGPDGKPTGYDIELLAPKGASGSLDPGKAIQRNQHAMAMVFFTQFLLLGRDKVGSFSLSSDQTDIYATALGCILGIIMEEFNGTVLPILMEANGIDERDWPTWEHRDLEKKDLVKFATAMSTLARDTLITPDNTLEDWVRDEVGAPPREDMEPVSDDPELRSKPADTNPDIPLFPAGTQPAASMQLPRIIPMNKANGASHGHQLLSEL